MSVKEIEILQDQIKFIDKRLSEIEVTLPRLKPGDYQREELLTEQQQYSARRRVADRQLRQLTGTDDPVERTRREKALAQTEALRSARMRSFRASCFETAAQFESHGDYRNATLHRLEALNARKIAEHEIS